MADSFSFVKGEWWAPEVLIKAVPCVRSEPTTLGPLPQGAQNQCRGRGASFIFLGSIDSHLPPSLRRSLERRGKARASQEQEFASNYFPFFFLLFDGLSAASISLRFTPEASEAPLQVNPLTGFCSAGDQETAEESVYSVSPGALLFIFTARHLFFLSTPPLSRRFRRSRIKRRGNERMLLRNRSVCNLSGARRGNRRRYVVIAARPLTPARLNMRRRRCRHGGGETAKGKKNLRNSRLTREAFINHGLSVGISANEI